MSNTETQANIKDLARAHEAARAERRKLEAELAGIEGQIKDAINAGDGVALSQLGRRKRELPFLIGEAGTLENAAANKEWVARQAIPSAQIPAAEEAVSEAQRALAKRRAEHEQEIAALQSEVVKTQEVVNRLYNECESISKTFGQSNVRFKEELARLNS